MPLLKGYGVIPIPILFQESPNLGIVNRYTRVGLFHILISMTSVLIDTSCVAIKHQSAIAKFGDSWDKTGIGITPDPFGRGAYNLQSISATRKKVVWFTRLLYCVLFVFFSPLLSPDRYRGLCIRCQ